MTDDQVMEYRVGCLGWNYRHWKGDFYPARLPQSRWLEYYSSVFDTVELNFSHYRLPAQTSIERWRTVTPPGFAFAVKASRFLTHYYRLANFGESLDRFIDRMSGLGDRLGPILYQLPARFSRDNARLESFLKALPRQYKHVFEFRDRSWWTEPVYELLRAHGAAFCVFNLTDTTTPLIATCPDLYLRFHGPGALYASNYDDAQLRAWADRLRFVPGVERIWAYFNNDGYGFAPRNALRLREFLTSTPSPAPRSSASASSRRRCP